MLPCCPIRRRKSLACHINQSHLWDCQCMVQGLSIYIDLHHALKIVAKESLKHFLSNIWRKFIFFSTFEPKKCKCAFRVAVSACTLKILCCGYNLATQKRRKFIKNYDTRRCKEYSFSSLSIVSLSFADCLAISLSISSEILLSVTCA